MKVYDDGTKARPFPHALVAGVAKSPLKARRAETIGGRSTTGSRGLQDL